MKLEKDVKPYGIINHLDCGFVSSGSLEHCIRKGRIRKRVFFIRVLFLRFRGTTRRFDLQNIRNLLRVKIWKIIYAQGFVVSWVVQIEDLKGDWMLLLIKSAGRIKHGVPLLVREDRASAARAEIPANKNVDGGHLKSGKSWINLSTTFCTAGTSSW